MLGEASALGVDAFFSGSASNGLVPAASACLAKGFVEDEAVGASPKGFVDLDGDASSFS